MPFLSLLAATLASQPPHERFELAAPLPTAPPVMIDRDMSLYGIANETARNRGLQARILWIDQSANLERIGSEEKIVALVDKVKTVGFNTIVLDIKAISGETLYPSKYAPKMTEWKGQKIAAD